MITESSVGVVMIPSYTEWKHTRRWGLPAFDTLRRYWGSCEEVGYVVRLRQRHVCHIVMHRSWRHLS